MNIVIIASTNGSVISKLLPISFFKEKINLVISDRPCGAIDLAKENNIKTKILPSETGLEFSNRIIKSVDLQKTDLFISFYTKLFGGPFLDFTEYKLINLHPSILPACPGLNGFEDTIKSKSRFIGSTIHFVNQHMDAGAPIIQSATPYNPNKSILANRHEVFIDQCKTLLQVIQWFSDNRILITEEGVEINNAKYFESRYSPNLDFDEAINFNCALTEKE